MRSHYVCLLVVSLLVMPAVAQTPADLSGHWQGSITLPAMTVAFEVDLTKDATGALQGTFSMPGEKLKGLPLNKVAVEGRKVTIVARDDQPLVGTIEADGSINGDVSLPMGQTPFTMARTGDARIAPPLKSAAITKALEGTWNGTLDVDGGLHLVLTLTNQSDGTASGRIVNLDQGNLQLPVAITQKDSAVTLETTVVASTYSGTLNADGTELAGTFRQGDLSVPLTFRKP